MTDQLDLFNGRRVNGEDLLHTDAEGHAADGDGLGNAAVLLGDDGALKDLDTLAGALLDLDVDPDGVTDLGGGGLGLHVFLVEEIKCVHGIFLLIYRRS